MQTPRNITVMTNIEQRRHRRAHKMERIFTRYKGHKKCNINHRKILRGGKQIEFCALLYVTKHIIQLRVVKDI